MIKVLPNCISFSRIIFSLFLLFVKPLGTAFFILYIICGLSDIADGIIARKTGTTSSLGAKLDSAGDMVLAGVLLFILYPIINPPIYILIWIISIAIIRLSSMVAALKKYKTFASIHTYGNKATGLVLFIFPLVLPLIHAAVLMCIICIIASLSAIEELIIQLVSSQLQLDRHSIFEKWIFTIK